MAEFIERKALITKFKKMELGEHGLVERLFADGVYAVIAAFPAADVAPVVHGRWEWFDEDVGTPVTGYEREWGWRCSHCGEELPDDYDDPDDSPKFRFCYNCGAKMDGEP